MCRQCEPSDSYARIAGTLLHGREHLYLWSLAAAVIVSYNELIAVGHNTCLSAWGHFDLFNSAFHHVSIGLRVGASTRFPIHSRR